MAGAQRFLVGLIGSDLGPSLSPPLHEREADHLGVRYLYQRIDLDVLGLRAEDVGDLVAQAHRFGFAGLNITHPSKQAVVKYREFISKAKGKPGYAEAVKRSGERAKDIEDTIKFIDEGEKLKKEQDEIDKKAAEAQQKQGGPAAGAGDAPAGEASAAQPQ